MPKAGRASGLLEAAAAAKRQASQRPLVSVAKTGALRYNNLFSKPAAPAVLTPSSPAAAAVASGSQSESWKTGIGAMGLSRPTAGALPKEAAQTPCGVVRLPAAPLFVAGSPAGKAMTAEWLKVYKQQHPDSSDEDALAGV